MTSVAGPSATPEEVGPRKPSRIKKPNYNLIHKDPLPLAICPLPPLIPHNPISLLHLLFAYFFPSRFSYAHPNPLYTATFSLSTRSVNVTDAASIQGLWCRGFFGKGSLSRSEPTWLTRTKRRLGAIGQNENLTAEEVTERRRNERREFKKERARKEKERLERVLVEEGKLVLASPNDGDVAAPNEKASQSPTNIPPASKPVIDIKDLEHLQLTLEEAFFLSYGLGVLKISNDKDGRHFTNQELLTLFRTCSYFPHVPVKVLQPDDPFLVNYVVYHHFRSRGWVIKTGVKFSVDYLLYNRGPAFSHAEFAVVVLPSYSHSHWTSDVIRKTKERPPWHWLHCVNRVCSQVKKTLILCYVEIPPPTGALSEKDVMKGDTLKKGDGNDIPVAELLKSYKVREVAIRRWVPSRNRD